jgi:hypothetical protein
VFPTISDNFLELITSDSVNPIDNRVKMVPLAAALFEHRDHPKAVSVPSECIAKNGFV